MKNRLNEEKNYMKYLFNYKKGVVVSEQDDKPDDIFKKSESPTRMPSTTSTPVQSTKQDGETQDLEAKRKQLQDELNKVNSKLESAGNQAQTDVKIKTLESLTLELDNMDKKLKESCNVPKWKMTHLCKTWMKERNNLQSQINKLKFVEAETKKLEKEGDDKKSTAGKTTEWITVISSVVAIISSIIGLSRGINNQNNSEDL